MYYILVPKGRETGVSTTQPLYVVYDLTAFEGTAFNHPKSLYNFPIQFGTRTCRHPTSGHIHRHILIGKLCIVAIDLDAFYCARAYLRTHTFVSKCSVYASTKFGALMWPWCTEPLHAMRLSEAEVPSARNMLQLYIRS